MNQSRFDYLGSLAHVQHMRWIGRTFNRIALLIAIAWFVFASYALQSAPLGLVFLVAVFLFIRWILWRIYTGSGN
jgi:hypothetical protein